MTTNAEAIRVGMSASQDTQHKLLISDTDKPRCRPPDRVAGSHNALFGSFVKS